jgi:hypothetical protein
LLVRNVVLLLPVPGPWDERLPMVDVPAGEASPVVGRFLAGVAGVLVLLPPAPRPAGAAKPGAVGDSFFLILRVGMDVGDGGWL